jgi:hypothetical protein
MREEVLNGLLFGPKDCFLDEPAMHIYRFLVDNDVQEAEAGLPYVLFSGNGHKLGRLLGEHVPISENVIAELVHLMTATAKYDDDSFSIIKGKDITHAYAAEIGGYSCMTGVCGSSAVKLYEENPDTVRMLLYGNCARALLWKAHSGDLVVDRIYPNSGPHVYHYYLWAARNSAWRRYSQGKVFSGWVHGSTDVSTLDMHVRVGWPSSKRFPYLDSFKYGTQYLHDGKITLWSNPEYMRTEYVERRGCAPIEGGSIGENTEVCDECGQYCDDGNLCAHCHAIHFMECHQCTRTVDTRTDSMYEAYADRFMTESVFLCYDCCADTITTCENCQRTYLSVAIDTSVVRGLGDVICPVCMENAAYYCAQCDEYVSYNEWDSNRDICLDCSSDSPEDEE